MLDKDMIILEIKSELKGKGDFVQIDNLTKLLKEKIRPEVRKFVYQKLGEIYEAKGMYVDAAKMCHNVAIACIAFSEKRNYHLKEAELYITAGKYNDADEAMKKAMREANAPERAEIFVTIKEFYKRQAEELELKRRKNQATKIYEKLLRMVTSNVEKKEIKIKLLELYDNLGMVREYLALKKEAE